MQVNGLEVVINPDLLVDGPTEVKTQSRSWSERLFTFPWKPFERTKQVEVATRIPSPTIHRFHDTLWMHPDTWEALKSGKLKSVDLSSISGSSIPPGVHNGGHDRAARGSKP